MSTDSHIIPARRRRVRLQAERDFATRATNERVNQGMPAMTTMKDSRKEGTALLFARHPYRMGKTRVLRGEGPAESIVCCHQ